jgi:hypothetical protein
MRPISDELAEILTGSRSGDRLVVRSWYDGQNTVAELPVSAWSLSWDGTRQVQGQLSLKVADSDGALAPWGVEEPLGVGGSRLQCVYVSGGESLDLGWYRITRSAPAESWTVHSTAGVWVSVGAEIPVQADDLTVLAVASKFLVPEQPASGATVLGEVRRLLDGIVPVTVAAGVSDRAVPSTVVYDRERMDAVEDLLETVNAAHRMTGDGILEVYPRAQTASVATLAGGPGGVLVNVAREQSVDDLFNAAVSEGTVSSDGQSYAVVGRAFEQSGPLRWNGPHGQWPVFRQSPLITTQAQADADARTFLANRVSTRSVLLDVTCLPNPALQIGDRVTIAQPISGGQETPLSGLVESMRLSGGESGVDQMQVAVRCAFDDVQAVTRLMRGAA